MILIVFRQLLLSGYVQIPIVSTSRKSNTPTHPRMHRDQRERESEPTKPPHHTGTMEREHLLSIVIMSCRPNHTRMWVADCDLTTTGSGLQHYITSGHVSCTLLLPRCYVPVVVVYLSMCMCLCLAFECFRDNKLWCNPLLLLFISRTLSPVVILIIFTLHTLPAPHLNCLSLHRTHRHTHGSSAILITTAAEREQSQ